LLDLILRNVKQSENLAIITITRLLRVAIDSPALVQYLNSLPSPNILYPSLTAFLEAFIKRYFDEARSPDKHYVTYDRLEISKEANDIFKRFVALGVELRNGGGDRSRIAAALPPPIIGQTLGQRVVRSQRFLVP
jgi:hypothetical protein